jgi:hypothetical protein
VSKELLNCYIVNDDGRNITYEVQDSNNIVVATGVSSSPDYVKHDAGGYHTKKRFDDLFPDGWTVRFEFDPTPLQAEDKDERN